MKKKMTKKIKKVEDEDKVYIVEEDESKEEKR